MGATVSYKLKNSLQGALAGGGDPATSPLYVFGPFLSFIVGAGVASITFGASIWLAVLTVFCVSGMYRYVMMWIRDGSGGSGLSEEEFGSWAVKANAAITIIEYTLTFLVSMAALVTFIADRFPLLATDYGLLDGRKMVAILLSILVATIVNRGPHLSSQFFGPATAAILLFLWFLIFTVIWQHGLTLPPLNMKAFEAEYLSFTLGGFARILALMTGIEIFANLVASYEGSGREKSNRAFGSMLIVMGTTVASMLILGPAILEVSDPFNTQTSVFTQTMDYLLPPWASYIGSLIGIAVLLSAAAASAQGIQNLSLGLRARHYIPAKWGTRNTFDVPSNPTWFQVIIVIVTFFLFGTHEETYLALYAAGVFILLSMTGWSAFKRFVGLFRVHKSMENTIGVVITLFASVCATVATLIIFEERFFDGAWLYLILIPVLYAVFDYYRKNLGAPPEDRDIRLNLTLSASPIERSESNPNLSYKIHKILVPLNGTMGAETAFFASLNIASSSDAAVYPTHIIDPKKAALDFPKDYLDNLTTQWQSSSYSLHPLLLKGDKEKELIRLCTEGGYDLICMSTSKLDSREKLIRDPIAFKVIYATTPPVLFFRPTNFWRSRFTTYKKILVPLDGSQEGEQVLPYVRAWSSQYNSSVTFLSVPEIQGDVELVKRLQRYLEEVKRKYFNHSDEVHCIVDGSGPSRTILGYAKQDQYDLIAMVSHGRGGVERSHFVRIGSVTEAILTQSDTPLLFISAKPSELKT